VAFPKVNRNLPSTQEATYGPSIAFSEDDEWRKHRRIAQPSFTESNNALVWESTIEVSLGYFSKWNRDGKGSIVKVSDFTEVTTQIAYMVFSGAGG
jgi:cytochrome P450